LHILVADLGSFSKYYNKVNFHCPLRVMKFESYSITDSNIT